MNDATQPEKLPLTSLDISAEKQERLRQCLAAAFPEIMAEDTIDFDQLKRVLGEWVEPDRERFGLNWPGKAACMKVIQAPSIGTLKPCPTESVDWDKTENVFIEGDNLEVLKLLQKAYFGKIKMIYIDPPYNTGKEFIYPDKYSETLDTYLEYTGQKDSEGRRFSTNMDSSGRFHSRWLSMMYPRLYLAKNLLRDDGVIFISIDDHEVEDLKILCSSIFGDENFIGCFVVNSTPNARDYGHIGKMHEYVLFYAKNNSLTQTYELPQEDKTFRFSDELGGFNIHPLYNSNVAFHSGNRQNLFYPFYINPKKEDGDLFYQISLERSVGSVEVFPPKSQKEGVQFVWRWGRDLSRANLNKEIVGYRTEDGEFRIVQKLRHTTKLIRSMMLDKDYSSRRGTAEVEELFGKKVFAFPKPVSLIKDFIEASTRADDIVLDFFAGSATTAHAIFLQNIADSQKRRFILVQLPELVAPDSDEHKAGFENIAALAKDRIRRAANRISESNGQLDFNKARKFDLGTRMFKLSRSNFKQWQPQMSSVDAIEQQLELHVDHIDATSTPEDILFELLLKAGFPLTTTVESLTMAGKSVFSIEDGAMLVCLDRNLTQEVIDAIADANPLQVICLDAGFQGNDQLKANAVQTFKARARNRETAIEFRTV